MTAAPEAARGGKARSPAAKAAGPGADDGRSLEIASCGSQPPDDGRDADRVESKFAHLLQPIRVLADNWDIDLAKELEEYVGELAKLSFTFDGGITRLNFAEAALLIQGSACVYSKKVEYLYEMVHQTLEAIMDRRKRQKPSVGENVVAADISLTIDDEFLAYDDIQESSNIDLKEEDSCLRKKDGGGVPLLPRIPPSLIPSTTDVGSGHDSANVELVSSTGEVIGRRDDFKINTATVHPSGALLLDNSERFFDNPCSLVAAAMNAVDDFDRSNAAVSGNGDATGGCAESGQDEHMDYGDVGDPLSDHEMDVDCTEAADNGPPCEPLAANEDKSVPQPPCPRTAESDPWHMLDPHALGTMPNRPLKKGRTYRMPKIKKEEEEGESADVVPVTKFLKRMEATLQHRRPLPKDPADAPAFDEFDYVFFAEEKLRLAAEQEVCASTRSPAAVGDGDWDRLDVTSPWDFPPVKTCEVPAGDEAVVATVPPEGAFDEFEAGWDDPVGFESDNHRSSVGDPKAPAQPPRLHESGVEGVVPETYEDLCKLRIDSYLLNAERFETEVESTLAKRVKRWEMRLKPILEEQERRAFLDVGMYGNRVVGTLVTNETAEANVVVPFADLVKNVDRCEVPRFFLATLHLANARNVDIVSSAADGLGVKLLDRNVRRLEA